MKLYLILLCCCLSLGAFSQQEVSVDSLKKWRQDTAALGQRVIFLRSKTGPIQKELERQFYLAADTKNTRDTLHDIDPKVYQFHWDSLTNVMIYHQSKRTEVQNSFDSILVQLDSTLGAQNAIIQRLRAASQQRRQSSAVHK